jgi:hypothetical protein
LRLFKGVLSETRREVMRKCKILWSWHFEEPAFAELWRGEHRYWFHKYFHRDIGAGLGASHQTGWTGLVAKLIQQQGEFGTIATL